MSVSLTTVFIVPGKQETNEYSVQISSQLYHKLALGNDQRLILSIGKKTLEVKLKITEQSHDELVLSENVFHEFLLPIRSYKLQALYKGEFHILQLGPIIGLLTDLHVNQDEDPNFRSIHLFCEELHHGIERVGGFFYVFSFHDFADNGYYFVKGKWKSAQLPLPDVIYNRVHSRRLEHLKSFKQFRKKLAQLTIPLFNDRFLSKWEVYEHLIKEKHLHAFIPETKLFSKESLNEYIQKYETVYIKPVHGSQGRNILKIIKNSAHHFSYQTSFQSKQDEPPSNYSLEELYHHLKQLIGNRIFIIQQGIPLAHYNGCVMDFRSLCHKSGINDWKVTSLVARISAEQEIVSNLAKGGRVLRPLHALCSCMDQKEAMKIILLMKELSISVSEAISKSSSGITGELGIDIGIDQSGKLWLIEVNSKPSKSFEDGQVKIRPSAKAIIQFCKLLTFDSSFEKEEA